MLENARKALRYRDDGREGWRDVDLRVGAILRVVGVVGTPPLDAGAGEPTGREGPGRAR